MFKYFLELFVFMYKTGKIYIILLYIILCCLHRKVINVVIFYKYSLVYVL